MRAKYAVGDELYATHLIIGTEVGTGCRVTIIESYTERGYEPRYYVKSPGGFRVFCYESDLATRNPLDRDSA